MTFVDEVEQPVVNMRAYATKLFIIIARVTSCVCVF
jgi:hypothetical protein